MLKLNQALMNFIINAVTREFSQRGKRAMLGRLWIVIQPLAMITIFTLVFSQLFHSRLAQAGMENQPFAYSIYLCAGILPWMLFTEGLGKMQSAYLDHAHLLRKMSMPFIVPQGIALGISVINAVIIFLLYLLFLLFIDHVWLTGILISLVLVILQIVLIIALGMFLSIVNVFFRDVQQVTNLLFQFGFWLTPLVYSWDVIPTWIQNILIYINPMLGLVLWQQSLYLNHQLASFTLLLPVMVWIFVGGVLSWVIYQQRYKEMLDEL